MGQVQRVAVTAGQELAFGIDERGRVLGADVSMFTAMPGLAQWIDARLFHDRDRCLQLFRVLEEPAPEHEHAVSARAVGQVG